MGFWRGHWEGVGCPGYPRPAAVTLPVHAARRGADGPPRPDPAGAGRVPGPPGVGAGAAAAQRQRGPGERQRLDWYAGTGTLRRRRHRCVGGTVSGRGCWRCPAEGAPCPSAAGGGEHGGPRDGAAGAPVPRLPAGDAAARRHPRTAQQTAPGTALPRGGQRVGICPPGLGCHQSGGREGEWGGPGPPQVSPGPPSSP